MKWTYPFVAFAVVFIIGFGLVNVIKEDIAVAPLAGKTAEEGRLIANTKNVTRHVNAGAADLHHYLQTAIPYPEAKTIKEAPTEKDWENFFTRSQKVNKNAKHVIIISGGAKEELKYALPALYYAYFYGSPVFFYENRQLDGPSGDFSHLKAYVIGPEKLIPSEAANEFNEMERITGANYAELALEIAEYRDEETEFGWGRKVDRRNSYNHFVVTTPHDVLKGLAAIPYAVSNNATLLYAEEDGGLSSELDRYIFSQRSDWFKTPSEGPFRHFWIVSNRISYAAHSRMDFAVEKAEYASKGAIALGDLEALLLIFVIWGVASALFVWVHATLTLSMVKMPVKIAWGLSSLLLPILGPALYLSSYRRKTIKIDSGEWRWIRPHSIQSATATAMGFGYGATLMVAIGFLFVWFGFPLFYEWTGPFFWLGSGMPLMMIGMYVFAVLVAWLLVQYPMKKSMMPGMSSGKLRKMAFSTTALSMLAVSLGMMSITWFMLMVKIPMMPKEDDVLWFGSIWIASFAGFLIAWPLNWLMIRKELKPGNV
ncbi:MAG: DUF4396 domain-containing protein [Candidatus Cyclobacteriaceae bacterium M2_1C_046]